MSHAKKQTLPPRVPFTNRVWQPSGSCGTNGELRARFPILQAYAATRETTPKRAAFTAKASGRLRSWGINAASPAPLNVLLQARQRNPTPNNRYTWRALQPHFANDWAHPSLQASGQGW